MLSNATLDRALWLESQGCSVIPLMPRSKRPCAELLPKGAWKEYQTRRANAGEIKAWFDSKPDINIALVCGAISGVVCVDVDGEKGQAWFKQNMPRPNLFQFTSSEHKFHAFYKHPGKGCVIPPSVKGISDEIDIRGDGSYCVFSPSIHPDTGKPYNLRELDGFTGMESLVACPDVTLPKKGDEVVIAENACIPSALNFSGDIPDGQRDSTLTSWCARWYAKGLTVDEILLLAHGLNAAKCKPPLESKQVEKIVRSIGKTHEHGHPLALNTGGLQAWLDLQGDGTFTVSDVFQQLGIHEQRDREQVLLGLKALRDSGVIEQSGISSSTFRKVVSDLQEIDLSKDEQGAVIPFNFLFCLDRNIQLRQKNVIVVAGESNSGKTAFLFNHVFINQKLHKFRYLTSEMTTDEINDRIRHLGTQPQDFAKFCKFYTKTQNYEDAIDPEGFNIIDFLEVYEDFSKIGKKIKAIFDRLTTGVAIIAIQKKRGEMFGRGGEFTIEKARLAISLFTHGHLEDGIVGSAMITKCKNFVPGKNPDHQEIFYTLQNGSYYKTRLPNVFDGQHRYFSEKERKRIIDSIQSYCRLHQRSQQSIENLDAYGYAMED